MPLQKNSTATMTWQTNLEMFSSLFTDPTRNIKHNTQNDSQNVSQNNEIAIGIIRKKYVQYWIFILIFLIGL